MARWSLLNPKNQASNNWEHGVKRFLILNNGDFMVSIIVAPRNHLFASWSKDDGVFLSIQGERSANCKGEKRKDILRIELSWNWY